jgi:hypothetical protein
MVHFLSAKPRSYGAAAHELRLFYNSLGARAGGQARFGNGAMLPNRSNQLSEDRILSHCFDK